MQTEPKLSAAETPCVLARSSHTHTQNGKIKKKEKQNKENVLCLILIKPIDYWFCVLNTWQALLMFTHFLLLTLINYVWCETKSKQTKQKIYKNSNKLNQSF